MRNIRKYPDKKSTPKTQNCDVYSSLTYNAKSKLKKNMQQNFFFLYKNLKNKGKIKTKKIM